MKYLRTRIIGVDYPAPNHALLRFAGDEAINATPGEFVMVRGDWGVHPVLPRAFSLVESGATGAILVKAIGEGTERLAAMVEGDDLVVFGPLGRGYEIDHSHRKPILVAGGVGVAPLLFLARELARDGVQSTFLYGARSDRELPLAAEIARSAELVVTTEDGSRGEQGLITAPLERLLTEGPDAIIYTCGPEGMLQAVANVAQAHGVTCQVALEAPMACGLGTCKGCAVMCTDGRFRYVCHDGPVFDSAVVFPPLEAAS